MPILFYGREDVSSTLGVMDVRAFGSWMSAPKCLFFQGFEGPAQSFQPKTSARMTRGRPEDYLEAARGVRMRGVF